MVFSAHGLWDDNKVVMTDSSVFAQLIKGDSSNIFDEPETETNELLSSSNKKPLTSRFDLFQTTLTLFRNIIILRVINVHRIFCPSTLPFLLLFS